MSCFRFASAVLTIAVALGLASIADAQQRTRFQGRGDQRGPGGPGGFGGGFGGMGGQGMDAFSLLRSEGIQKELEIGEDQQRSLAELREQMQRDLDDAQRQVRDRYQAKIEEVLLPHQAERVQQITMQLRGADALLEPKTAETLGLNASQTSKLRGVREEYERKTRALFAGGGEGGGGQERFQQMRDQRQQRDEAMLAVLTADQKKKYEELKGEEFDRSSLGSGGPGGPGGGPRGRPGN